MTMAILAVRRRGAAAVSPWLCHLRSPVDNILHTRVTALLLDQVRAEVVSLGDARSYHLTTARNELGVVHATSMAGNPLVPISWEEMVRACRPALMLADGVAACLIYM